MKIVLSVAAAAAALIAVPAALAGPSLHVGAADDVAIWGNPGAEMDRARSIGLDQIRMTVQWSAGATAPARGQMAKVQAAAQAARARGIEPIVAIYNAGSTSTPADDGSRAKFVTFARNVVAALPWVTTFIVGNEPNSNTYWQPQFDAAGGNAAAVAYERLLADTYDAIKALRPSATVVGGALDPRGSDDPNAGRPSHSPTAFIRDLGVAYRASGRTTPLMDVFDEHVYADNSSLPPSMTHVASTTLAEGDYTKLVALLGQAFDGTAQRGSTLPILYGEFGVETQIPAEKSGAYTGTEPASSGAVDEATQASYYAEAFRLALCQPNVIGILVFHTVDESALGAWQSGAFYADGTSKSSADAIRQAAAAARAGSSATCPDTTAPSVQIAAPGPDGSVSGTVTDAIGVGRVELFVNGATAGVKYAAPYSIPWQPARAGRYVLELRGSDAAGNVGRSSVTVVAQRAARGGASGSASASGWTFGPPPTNDLFAASQPLSGRSGGIGGSTVFASAELGEPVRRSVWYTWHARAHSHLRLAANGARISVYVGSSIRHLRLIAGGAGVTLTSARAATYRIAVGGTSAFRLSWRS